jgi:uncharacterized protein
MTRTHSDSSESEVAVSATMAALEVLRRLEAAHGPLIFFQSGGCCDGTSPICLRRGELPAGPHDLELGELGGTPFYIDADQYERWGRPRFEIDVSPGAAEGFSLEGLEGVHFVTRPPSESSTESDRPAAR